jgi:hypothetical protein
MERPRGESGPGFARSVCIAGVGSSRPDRKRDVFQVLLAHIDELSRHLASDMIVGRRRDADAARFCDALKPCRNIYAVAKDVMRLDDYIADTDAHTESRLASMTGANSSSRTFPGRSTFTLCARERMAR